MAKTRTYVKHIEIMPDRHKDVDSLLDALILKETNTNANFRDITACMDDAGVMVYTIVFERMSS